VVNSLASSHEQHLDSSVAKTAFLICNFFDLFFKCTLILFLQAVTYCRSIGPHQAARSPLASVVLVNEHIRACPFGLWGYHFLETISFRATMSRLNSPTSLFSLEFSVSSALKRLVSETVIPPNLAFQL
jgi:hypothetical protein